MPRNAKSNPTPRPGDFHNAKTGAVLSEQVRNQPRESMEGILAERAEVVRERAEELETDDRKH